MMPIEMAFQLCNGLAIAGWLLLITLPNRQLVSGFIGPVLIPAVFAIIYLALVASQAGIPDFGSLSSVRQVFSNDEWLLAGWVHYLAFDLIVGCWIVRDAATSRISRWATLPCLVFTFLAGPIGWLGYMGLRCARVRRWQVGANA